MAKMGKNLFFSKDSYLFTSGYFRSITEGYPADEDGNEIPWMNFAVVKLLEARLTKEMNLFEFGSGSSTRFFAGRVASIVSCEHDKEWHRKVAESLPANATLLLRKETGNGEYCKTVSQQEGNFDLVVVDGPDRTKCVREAVGKLSETGVILLDDSHRKEYRQIFESMQSEGYRNLTIEGLKPLKKITHSTTIFYRPGNCLGL